MSSGEFLRSVYREMYDYYAVSRSELPVGFKHRKTMDLGKYRLQHTYSSCGQSMGMIGMKVQGIPFDPGRESHRAWLRELIPTYYQGIDMGPLARGIKAAGVACTEYYNADPQLLAELLRYCPSVCVLAIQAPWCKPEEIERGEAGHYVAAGHVNLRKGEVYVHDSGNGSPWGRMKLKYLESKYKIWQDSLIGKKDKVVKGWMLHIPVTVPLR